MTDGSADETPAAAELGGGLRIVIVDDSDSIRGVLSRVLGSRPGLAVVADYDSARAASMGIRRDEPDIIVMDLHMRGYSGPDAVRLLSSIVEAPILILTGSARNNDVAAVLKAGARGCVLKQVDVRELDHAIRTVAAGGRYVAAALRASEPAE